jgi:hypothetical protein
VENRPTGLSRQSTAVVVRSKEDVRRRSDASVAEKEALPSPRLLVAYAPVILASPATELEVDARAGACRGSTHPEVGIRLSAGYDAAKVGVLAIHYPRTSRRNVSSPFPLQFEYTNSLAVNLGPSSLISLPTCSLQMPRSVAHEARNKAFRDASIDNGTTRANATPTAQLIPAQAQELGVKWEVEDVPDGQGGRLHWVGDRAAKKVILYFHGDHLHLPRWTRGRANES